MKKIAVLFLSYGFSGFLWIESGSNEARKTMRGDWQLTSITYPGNDQDVQVSLLNDIPARCLENSTWNFISNNNTGSYEPSGMQL